MLFSRMWIIGADFFVVIDVVDRNPDDDDDDTDDMDDTDSNSI